MNLKQAARELGMHYQTAYKLVRSGSLAAVRVGGGYEISDAALARYVAQKEATRRVPTAVVDVRHAEGILDERAALLDAAQAALDATTLSGRAVLDIVAEGLARVLGDLAVVRPLSGDRRWLLAGAVGHTDPRRRSVATAVVDAFPTPTTEGDAGVAIATRAPVFIPHVPQDRYRNAMPPELLQHLDDAGAHSLICVPAVHGGEVYAIVSVSRDTPGHPYGREDVAFVADLAAIVGAALVRARSAADGWQRRHALMQGATRVIDGAYAGMSALLREEGFAELICDGNGTVIAANETAARMRGVPARRCSASRSTSSPSRATGTTRIDSSSACWWGSSPTPMPTARSSARTATCSS